MAKLKVRKATLPWIFVGLSCIALLVLHQSTTQLTDRDAHYKGGIAKAAGARRCSADHDARDDAAAGARRGRGLCQPPDSNPGDDNYKKALARRGPAHGPAP